MTEFLGRFVQVETIGGDVYEGYVKAIDQQKHKLVLHKGTFVIITQGLLENTVKWDFSEDLFFITM